MVAYGEIRWRMGKRMVLLDATRTPARLTYFDTFAEGETITVIKPYYARDYDGDPIALSLTLMALGWTSDE